MHLMIEDGRWTLVSGDVSVRITINPRRSAEGEPTRATLRAEPMPLLELSPEDWAGQPAEAWVWDGTPDSARALSLLTLEGLRDYLRPDKARVGAARTWRVNVLASLFPESVGQPEHHQTQRA